MLKHLRKISHKLSQNGKYKYPFSEYQCSCGNIVQLNRSLVNSGNITECIDCQNKYLIEKLGKNYSRLKKTWFYMIERCHNSSHPSYKRYGAKGITVCKEWRDSFEEFEKWSLDNGYNEKLQIDKDIKPFMREEVTNEYNPLNCMWVTQKRNNNAKKIIKSFQRESTNFKY